MPLRNDEVIASRAGAYKFCAAASVVAAAQGTVRKDKPIRTKYGVAAKNYSR
jgi:hypothetical protein